ncbi:MAG TPA: low temperature requirement protein A [Actinomycetes bacterium]|nr:low temperature requirement protein A [Actinomycetes bacterium]
MSQPPDRVERVERVSTLELFFDLVFVFTITQLTSVLSDDPTPRGLLRVVLMLSVIFYMYGGYAWMTNAVATDRAARRLLLLGGMAGFLVLALAVPRAFSEGDAAFGVAYLVIVSVHAGLYSRTSVAHTIRAVIRLAPFNLASALLVLAAVLVEGTAAYLLWAAAVAMEWFTPRLAGTGGFRIAPAHFVERHGLVVIVALGESIVAIGIGAADLPVNLALASVAVLGLLLAACLWWAYFGGDDARAERALAAVPDDRRGAVAIRAFGYWHLLMLLGIIALAAGLKDAIGHAFDQLDLAHALMLAGGVALFLVGDVLFRRTLQIGTGHLRAGAAALAMATIPLGLTVSALAQLVVLVAALSGSLLAEAKLAKAGTAHGAAA